MFRSMIGVCYTDNIVWKTVCFLHIVVTLAGAFVMSIVVVQLMIRSQQMNSPLRYEEGRSVTRSIL